MAICNWDLSLAVMLWIKKTKVRPQREGICMSAASLYLGR